jgi:formate dehydrogenase maturation protein FdhE
MSKKQHERKTESQSQVPTIIEPRARSRTFTAKPCTLCSALRDPNTNFTRVYATRDRVRYCKCTYCNNTWKDSDG